MKTSETLDHPSLPAPLVVTPDTLDVATRVVRAFIRDDIHATAARVLDERRYSEFRELHRVVSERTEAKRTGAEHVRRNVIAVVIGSYEAKWSEEMWAALQLVQNIAWSSYREVEEECYGTCDEVTARALLLCLLADE